MMVSRQSKNLINMADSRLGAKVISVTDEFFAPCERMLSPSEAVFVEGKYDQNGKWMDGWESRRKRVEGHDSCIVKLGFKGVIEEIDIDTSHFIGNFPPFASLDACLCDTEAPDDGSEWETIVPKLALKKDSHHHLGCDSRKIYTHVRLNIFPDGGVARLRVLGTPQSNWSGVDRSELLDFGSIVLGGQVIACSDECFGSSMHKLIYPDESINMGDGWETARRRVPGNEWVIIKLGQSGVLETIDLGTKHYKGNFPDSASVLGGFLEDSIDDQAVNQSLFWQELVPKTKMSANTLCSLEIPQTKRIPVTHVKINIHPDGGLSRVRLYGRLSIASRAEV